MLMAFPGYIFTIALVSFIGIGLPNMILAMSLTGWTYYARISRSLVLSVKNNVYIEQARLGGASLHEDSAGLYYSQCAAVPAGKYFPGYRRKTSDYFRTFASGTRFTAAHAGMGLYAFGGKNYMYSAPWMLIFPGLVILVSVVIFNLLGDCIQDLMNPKENVW
ncbi:MAG: ABC transporter permease subunit [Blautia sp.]